LIQSPAGSAVRVAHRMCEAALLIGVASLGCWALHQPEFTAIFRGLPAAVPTSAIACSLLALAIRIESPLATWSARRVASLALGAIALLMGSATIAEYVLRVPRGLETILFWEVAQKGNDTLYPGRMSPHTAAALGVLGAAVVLSRSGRRAIASWIALGAVGLSLLAILGHIHGVTRLLGNTPIVGMSAPIAMMLLLLSAALPMSDLEHGPLRFLLLRGIAGFALRWMLTGALVVPLALELAIRLGQMAGLYDSPFSAALSVSLNMMCLVAVIVFSAPALARAIQQQETLAQRRTERESERRAEQAIRENEARLHTIIEHLAEGVVVSDRAGNLVCSNRAALDMHGFQSLDECCRRMSDLANIFELSTLDGEVVPLDRWPLPRLLRGEPVRGMEFCVRRLDRDWNRVYSYGGCLVRETNDHPSMAVVSIKDVTEQKQSETELRKAEERFRNLAESLPQLVWATKGGDGDTIYSNRGFIEYTGRRVRTAQERQALIHPEDRPRVVEQWKASAGTASTWESECRLRRKDGQYRWFLIRHLTARDPAGEVSWIGTATDIHDLKEGAQARLRESETRYRLLFENMTSGFAYCRMLYDECGRPQDFVYLDVNDAFHAVTGLKEVVGKRASEVIPGIQHSQPELLERYGRVAARGQPETFEIDFQPLKLWLSISAYSPHPGHFVAIFHDITELKRVEQVLRATVQAKETLLREVHHRVKNNLQVVTSLLNLQMRGLEPGTARDALRESRGRIQSIAHFYERLHRVPDLTRIDAVEYLRDVVSNAFRAIGVDGISYQVEGDAFSLPVDAAVPCGLIVNELVTNALKHAFPEGRCGRVWVEAKASGERASLRIGNDGMDFDPDLARARPTLGMKLVESLAGQIGGAFEAVRAQSGAHFRLEFPLQN